MALGCLRFCTHTTQVWSPTSIFLALNTSPHSLIFLLWRPHDTQSELCCVQSTGKGRHGHWHGKASPQGLPTFQGLQSFCGGRVPPVIRNMGPLPIFFTRKPSLFIHFIQGVPNWFNFLKGILNYEQREKISKFKTFVDWKIQSRSEMKMCRIKENICKVCIP